MMTEPCKRKVSATAPEVVFSHFGTGGLSHLDSSRWTTISQIPTSGNSPDGNLVVISNLQDLLDLLDGLRSYGGRASPLVALVLVHGIGVLVVMLEALSRKDRLLANGVLEFLNDGRPLLLADTGWQVLNGWGAVGASLPLLERLVGELVLVRSMAQVHRVFLA